MPDGYKLGLWVGTQRTKRNKISHGYKERLEELAGWAWNKYEDQWEEGYGHLEEYVRIEGHARVPKTYRSPNGYKLGQWLNSQRTKREGISQERKDRLEAFSGWVWSAIEDQWENGFTHLEEFVQKEGHARVPQSYISPDGYKLGLWISNQRNKGVMSQERKDRFKALAG